jgi:putative transposase
MVDYIGRWAQRTELPAKTLLGWLGLPTSKFHDWKKRYGSVNEHNGKIPRDFWLEEWEKQAIVDFHDRHPLEGYRRLAFMMLDDDVVAVSPASVYRVLKRAGRLDRRWLASSRKGTGFVQPLAPHEHWHVDVSYINLQGTFYYLTSILDGASRYLVHWELRQSMTEQEIEVIVQRALERHPGVTPRIISDNGPQFIAREFKEHHPRPDEPLLSAVQRQAGTLARIAQTRMHPPRLSRHRGRGAASRVPLRAALQRGSLALSHRLHHPGGQAQRLG